MADQTQPHGKILASWTFPEYIRHAYSRRWYMITGTIVIGSFILAAVYANPLFAVIIMMIVAIYILRSRRTPATITLAITEDGIQLGSTFYAYEALKSFWIVYLPPDVKRLYFTFANSVSPNLSVPLEDQNPVRVRELLAKNIIEDLEQHNESFSDAFQRLLKL